MKIADLMKRKNQRVIVRVPAKLQEQLGAEVKGTVQGLKKANGTTKVKVRVGRKGEFDFRPQDLTAA